MLDDVPPADWDYEDGPTTVWCNRCPWTETIPLHIDPELWYYDHWETAHGNQ